MIRELIVALYVWFWYLKIDYHPLVGLPKKKSITICEFIVIPNKRWVCPASGRGANKKPMKLGGGIVTAAELGGGREDEKTQGRWVKEICPRGNNKVIIYFLVS